MKKSNGSWALIDWDLAEQTIAGFQRAITLAAIRRDWDCVIETQKRLVRSHDAKVLAVRHVGDSATMPGIDGVKWTTAADKMSAALSLTSSDYHAQPMKMIVVHPKGQPKERHIQIPTVYDRAMQALYAMALDPVSEALADRKSFAFRKGRSQADAHAFIISAFSGENPPMYAVKTDIKACYASISHEWLLRNIPMDERVLREFLKAGHFFGGELFPPDDFGISLGTSISPILGNMTLDGLQKAIFDGLNGDAPVTDYANGNLVRFADDIIISARDENTANRILEIITEFIAPRGLRLSPEKTQVVNLCDGFDFLSRHYQFVGDVLCATPSEAAVLKIKRSLEELIRPYKGGQKALIERLNQKLNGWVSYHKIADAATAFRHIDVTVKTLLLELCEKLDPKLSRKQVIEKYFYKDIDGEYVYALAGKSDVRVIRCAATILIEHRPVNLRKNVYLDTDYFESRSGDHAAQNASGKYKSLWVRQDGNCHYCGKPILRDHRRVLVPTDAARSTAKTLAYIHEHCSLGVYEYIDVDGQMDFQLDLRGLLERLNSPEEKLRKPSKFHALIDHFYGRTEPIFTMTFAEIEKIIGQKLCATAYSCTTYWYRKKIGNISEAWRFSGYKILRLKLAEKCVTFERETDYGVAANIPEVFLSGRIPPNAKAELDNFLGYLKKRYAL